MENLNTTFAAALTEPKNIGAAVTSVARRVLRLRVETACASLIVEAQAAHDAAFAQPEKPAKAEKPARKPNGKPAPAGVAVGAAS